MCIPPSFLKEISRTSRNNSYISTTKTGTSKTFERRRKSNNKKILRIEFDRQLVGILFFQNTRTHHVENTVWVDCADTNYALLAWVRVLPCSYFSFPSPSASFCFPYCCLPAKVNALSTKIFTLLPGLLMFHEYLRIEYCGIPVCTYHTAHFRRCTYQLHYNIKYLNFFETRLKGN